MDLSLTAILVLLAALLLALPLIGKKWSAIVSFSVFGPVFIAGLAFGYLGLSQPPLGPSHSFAQLYLVFAGFAAAMLALTYIVYRYRQRRASDNSTRTA